MICGGAVGLGATFTLSLARAGFDLIIVDKEKEVLEKLAGEIRDKMNINVRILHADLADQKSIDLMMELAQENGCRLFIYNAAYGPVKQFTDNSPEELDYYIDVNSRTPIKLIHRLGNESTLKGRRGFLLMSSLAGMLGTNLVGPYGATKAFNLNLSEALFHELRGKGMDILACVAGATDTPNFRSTNPKRSFLSPTPMNPQKVVREGFKNLGKQPYVIPGFSNKLTVFLLNRILGRKVALRIMNRTMQKMYGRLGD